MENMTIGNEAQDRLPWSKPMFERLTVSYDTANAGGSGGDFETMELIGQ
jgi:hypothetical protein